MLCLQSNASGSFLQTCINFVEQLLKFSHFEGGIIPSQPANIGPQDVPRTSHSNVPRTSPKGPIWPSRGRPNLTSRGHPDLTSWGRPDMTSRAHLNLTFKGRSLEDLQSTHTWMSQNFF